MQWEKSKLWNKKLQLPFFFFFLINKINLVNSEFSQISDKESELQNINLWDVNLDLWEKISSELWIYILQFWVYILQFRPFLAIMRKKKSAKKVEL